MSDDITEPAFGSIDDTVDANAASEPDSDSDNDNDNAAAAAASDMTPDDFFEKQVQERIAADPDALRQYKERQRQESEEALVRLSATTEVPVATELVKRVQQMRMDERSLMDRQNTEALAATERCALYYGQFVGQDTQRALQTTSIGRTFSECIEPINKILTQATHVIYACRDSTTAVEREAVEQYKRQVAEYKEKEKKAAERAKDPENASNKHEDGQEPEAEFPQPPPEFRAPTFPQQAISVAERFQKLETVVNAHWIGAIAAGKKGPKDDEERSSVLKSEDDRAFYRAMLSAGKSAPQYLRNSLKPMAPRELGMSEQEQFVVLKCFDLLNVVASFICDYALQALAEGRPRARIPPKDAEALWESDTFRELIGTGVEVDVYGTKNGQKTTLVQCIPQVYLSQGAALGIVLPTAVRAILKNQLILDEVFGHNPDFEAQLAVQKLLRFFLQIGQERQLPYNAVLHLHSDDASACASFNASGVLDRKGKGYGIHAEIVSALEMTTASARYENMHAMRSGYHPPDVIQALKESLNFDAKRALLLAQSAKAAQQPQPDAAAN